MDKIDMILEKLEGIETRLGDVEGVLDGVVVDDVTLLVDVMIEGFALLASGADKETVRSRLEMLVSDAEAS